MGAGVVPGGLSGWVPGGGWGAIGTGWVLGGVDALGASRGASRCGQRQMPARRVDTGMDNGDGYRGADVQRCWCAEWVLGWVPSWVSHWVPGVFRGLPMRRVGTGLNPGGWVPGVPMLGTGLGVPMCRGESRAGHRGGFLRCPWERGRRRPRSPPTSPTSPAGRPRTTSPSLPGPSPLPPRPARRGTAPHGAEGGGGGARVSPAAGPCRS